MIFDSSFLFVVNYRLQDWSLELNRVVNSAYETRVNTLIGGDYNWDSIELICAVTNDCCVEIADAVDSDNKLVLIHRYDSPRARKRIIEKNAGKFKINAHWAQETVANNSFEENRIKKFSPPKQEEGFNNITEHEYE